MAILKVENLTKKFKNFVAVDNLSFELREGEILGFLGPNGAGKTTTIQMLMGTLTPTSGSVSYFGKNLSKHRSEIMEDVSFSSTYTNLPWYLTVRQNLKWVSYLYDIKDRKTRINKIVEMFKMEDIIDQAMTELSAGQLTKVNMAKAFLNFPKVLLLDEPTASLDVEIAKHIRNLILEEQKEFKTSVIITSHNMQEVEELCDRVIVINHGKIIANDKPLALLKSIKLSHIELLVEKKLDKVEEYCKKQKFEYSIEGDLIMVNIPTVQISSFVEHLVREKVEFAEIGIERPSMEDYFLQVIGEKNYEIT